MPCRLAAGVMVSCLFPSATPSPQSVVRVATQIHTVAILSGDQGLTQYRLDGEAAFYAPLSDTGSAMAVPPRVGLMTAVRIAMERHGDASSLSSVRKKLILGCNKYQRSPAMQAGRPFVKSYEKES
ncbi:MAG: hypothetical protein K5683_09565 [Prevotella sp.]|nr:hypothetical protein [Prevotella sp.]